VLNTKNIAGKKVLGKYIYRIDQCTLCGLCVEACPFDAIKMSNEFEHAAWDRNGYDWVLNKKEGRG
jgi:NADH-quinone oxidoreductase subunit I